MAEQLIDMLESAGISNGLGCRIFIRGGQSSDAEAFLRCEIILVSMRKDGPSSDEEKWPTVLASTTGLRPRSVPSKSGRIHS